MNRIKFWRRFRFTAPQDSGFKNCGMTTARRLRIRTIIGMSRRYPIGVAHDQNTPLTQRSRCATTLGFGAQPLRGWIGLLIILTVSSVSQAQHTGSITGRISDVHNAAVVGAEVRLLARAGSQFTAVTDDNGAYSFTNLASGD